MIVSTPNHGNANGATRSSGGRRTRSPYYRPSANWSKQDDEILLRARAQGQGWLPISQRYFHGKSPNACRKRHERLMENKNKENWSEGVRFSLMAKHYMDIREQIWAPLAELMNEKWELVEEVCMGRGLKNISNAAHSKRNQGTQGYDGGDGMDDAESSSSTQISTPSRSPSFEHAAQPEMTYVNSQEQGPIEATTHLEPRIESLLIREDAPMVPQIFAYRPNPSHYGQGYHPYYN